MGQSAANANLQQNQECESVWGEIAVPIGTMDDGNTFIQDLGQIPHVLVCGFTGSGKTSFIQTIVANIATKYNPEKVKFIIYDSKMVDYTAFKSMPHLLRPVESDSKKATGIISWLSMEEKNRFKMFVDTGTKDIVSYNKQCEKNGNGTLPYIFVILDDFSSLQLSNHVTSWLVDILKTGRIVGIHIIIVTSQTSSKILHKDILSNMPCRITFCVSTRADSRVAIEQNGAEVLSVPGELIFRWQNQLVKCQSTYMSNEEVDKVVKKLEHQSRKNISTLGDMAAHIFEDSTNVPQDKITTTDFDEDPVLPYAVDAVLKPDQASTSLIQRKLKVGNDMPLSTKTVETQNPSASVTESTPVKTDNEENSEIQMRNFAPFSFNCIGLCISDNQIRISNKITTRFGPATTTVSFNGRSIAGLTFKKPHLFFRGYIQFSMKPKVNIVNTSPHLITATKDNLSNFLKIKFDNDVAHTIKSFMMQISEDIGIQLTCL